MTNIDEGMRHSDKLACVTVLLLQDDTDPPACFMDQMMRLLLPSEDRQPLNIDGGR